MMKACERVMGIMEDHDDRGGQLHSVRLNLVIEVNFITEELSLISIYIS